MFPRPGRQRGLAALCASYLPKAADSVHKLPSGKLLGTSPPGNYHMSHPAQFLIHKGKDRPLGQRSPSADGSPQPKPRSWIRTNCSFCGAAGSFLLFWQRQPVRFTEPQRLSPSPKGPEHIQDDEWGTQHRQVLGWGWGPTVTWEASESGGWGGPAPAFVISQAVSLTVALQSNFNKISMYQII